MKWDDEVRFLKDRPPPWALRPMSAAERRFAKAMVGVSVVLWLLGVAISAALAFAVIYMLVALARYLVGAQ